MAKLMLFMRDPMIRKDMESPAALFKNAKRLDESALHTTGPQTLYTMAAQALTAINFWKGRLVSMVKGGQQWPTMRRR